MWSMKKKAKILLIVLFIFLVQINGAMVCMAYKSRDDYKNAGQGIYDQMEAFSFTFNNQSIQYAVYFGGMFEKYNDTYKRFTIDVFVITLNEYYVTSLSASLSYDITISASGFNTMDSGSDADTSSFMQTGDVIYEFEIFEFYVHKDLFPVSMNIEFDYHLTSSEFDVIDSYSTTANFDWDPMFIFMIIGIVIGVVAVIVVVTIIIVVVRRRKRRTTITPSKVSNSTG